MSRWLTVWEAETHSLFFSCSLKNTWITDQTERISLLTLAISYSAYSLVMGVTGGGLIQREELLQLPKWEMPFYILLLIHHTATEGLLVGLALEYLLLYGPCLQERESEMKHSWDASVKETLHRESVPDQTPLSCQNYLVPCQTNSSDRQVLLTALQPHLMWLQEWFNRNVDEEEVKLSLVAGAHTLHWADRQEGRERSWAATANLDKKIKLNQIQPPPKKQGLALGERHISSTCWFTPAVWREMPTSRTVMQNIHYIYI